MEIREIDRKIKELLKLARELEEVGRGIPAVEKNLKRVMASLHMMELNVCDPLALSPPDTDSQSL